MEASLPPVDAEASVEDGEPLPVAQGAEPTSLKITPLEPESGERLRTILRSLDETEGRLWAQLEEKRHLENEKTDRIKQRLLQKIRSLPEEFLDSPADDETLDHFRLPVLRNMPSYAIGRSAAAQLRVVRVFNTDSDSATSPPNTPTRRTYQRVAGVALENWKTRFEELDQHLIKENEPTEK